VLSIGRAGRISACALGLGYTEHAAAALTVPTTLVTLMRCPKLASQAQ
jgi:hypothetical protein